MVDSRGNEILDLMRGYQASCVIAAAVDLNVFEQLADEPSSAEQLAGTLQCDQRGLTILLDALAAMGLIRKDADRYALVDECLRRDSRTSIISMLRHQAVCLRRWARLPWIVQAGAPQRGEASLLGEEADEEAFIQAMHVVSRDVAPQLVPEINPGGFRCLLDLGGATGSWTIAWLEAEPQARAIIFDLPHVIPMAQTRLAQAGVADRVTCVAGDFYIDPLPGGADLVWVSAIIHQNSRAQNRALFAQIAQALAPGGWVYIRDIVLDASRTGPVAGALFAVNMLTATEGGNSYTLEEIAADLTSAGFAHVELVRRDEGMHSVVRAVRESTGGPAT